MRYKVLSPIQGTDGRFNPGEFIDLTDRDAAQLLQVGAIEEFRLPYQSTNLSLNINLDDKK